MGSGGSEPKADFRTGKTAHLGSYLVEPDNGPPVSTLPRWFLAALWRGAVARGTPAAAISALLSPPGTKLFFIKPRRTLFFRGDDGTNWKPTIPSSMSMNLAPAASSAERMRSRFATRGARHLSSKSLRSFLPTPDRLQSSA